MPYFFGAEEEPLFGVYAPPLATVARDAAVLLCAPIGIEYQRSHYAIRLVAQQLARTGFHVLRFDYHGMGDSSGNIDAGQFDLWVNDVSLAARELFDLSGAGNLTVVGLRMGAALVVEALANKAIDAKGLVLWDPVVFGGRYLSTIEKLHAEFVAERTVPLKPTDELLGARFPQDLRAAIRGVNITDRLHKVDVQRAALIVSEDLPRYGKLLTAMRSRWPETIFQVMDDPINWSHLKAAYEGRMTGSIIRAVAEAAEGLA